MWAAAEGHVGVVEALIKAGADFRCASEHPGSRRFCSPCAKAARTWCARC